MKILPIAADSLGVRSMATLVTSGNSSLLLEPGLAVAEERFGLGPTNAERATYAQAAAQIVTAAQRADALLVASYQAGHHNLLPDAPVGTPVFAKMPLNLAEHRVSRQMFPLVSSKERPVTLADGLRFQAGDLEVQCSPPFPRRRDGDHEDTVLAVTVRGGGRTFVSVAGAGWPLSHPLFDHLLGQQPDLVYLSGPDLADRAAYPLAGLHDPPAWLPASKANIQRLLDRTGCRVIIDQGIVRDVRYRAFFNDLFLTGRVLTAAEFRGRMPNLLEARRKELAEREGVGQRTGARP